MFAIRQTILKLIYLTFVTSSFARTAAEGKVNEIQNNSQIIRRFNIENETGEIISPNYPGDHPSNQVTEWVIQVPDPGAHVHAYFVDYAVPQNSMIEIRDGSSEDARLIYSAYSTSEIVPILSSGPFLHIRYVAGIYTGRGFKLRYVQKLDLTYLENVDLDEFGSMGSPNFYSRYPPGIDYTWVFRSAVSSQTLLRLKFSAFAVRTIDELEIRDGEGQSSPLVGRYNNDNKPTVVITTGPALYVRFRVSETNTTGGGFIGRFESITPSIVETAHVLESPNYPYSYPKNTDTSWVLVSQDENISITMKLAGNLRDGVDYLQVRNGVLSDSPLLLNLTGNLANTENIRAKHLYLRLITEPTYADGQFSAVTVAEKFVVKFDGQRGEVRSAFYTSNYTNNLDHTWIVTLPEGHRIYLTHPSSTFETEEGVDVVRILDGNSSSSSPLLRALSGVPTYIPPFVSSGNQAVIHFTSNEQNTGKGFAFTFESINAFAHEVTLSAALGRTIMSPNYPVSPRSLEFSYVLFTNAAGERVVLEFTDFATSEPGDYVEVRDGAFANGTLLGRFWGTSLPPVLRSASKTMRVTYRTMDPTVSKGFMARADSHYWSEAIDPKGGPMSSENYPNNYTITADQTWLFLCPTSQVHLVFHDFFTLAPHDRVLIHNGRYTSSPIIATLVGQLQPPPPAYYSTGGEMLIRFKKDAVFYKDTAPGFLATFTCSERVTLLTNRATGEFTSPHFPLNYTNNLSHTWIITLTDSNGKVGLMFRAFSTELATDVLEVRDGESAESPLLASLSGEYAEPELPIIITSASSNKLFVRFASNGAGTDKGFSATYFNLEESCCRETLK